MNTEGWGREGNRRWHFYRNGVPICYQRVQYLAEGWRYGGVLHTHTRGLSGHVCRDCQFLLGFLVRSDDDELDRRIKIDRLDARHPIPEGPR